ncbi:MAG: DUF86 domain-containing protein [Methanospirillum sp.]
MSSRSAAVLVDDMMEAAERALGYVDGYAYPAFVADGRTFDAVLRNLEVLGEAAAQVPAPFRDRYPEIPWRQVVGLRNVVVHRYFAVDPETVWTIVTGQLPSLLPQLRELRRTLDDD